MSRRADVRDRWLRHVVICRKLDGETRAHLLRLGGHMTDVGAFTGYTREDIADIFGVIPGVSPSGSNGRGKRGYSTASAAVTRGTPRPGKPSFPTIHSVRKSAPQRRQRVRAERTQFPHPINGHINRTGCGIPHPMTRA